LEDIDLTVLLVFFFFFLALGAFFSIAETRLMAVNRYRIRYLVGQGHRPAKAVEKLMTKVEDLLAFVLLGNNFANTMSATIAATIAGRIYGGSPSVLLLVSLVVTLAILVFAELTPKTLAAARPEWFALPLGPILLLSIKIFHPFLLAVNFVASMLLRTFGLGGTDKGNLSMDELRTVILEASGFIPLQHRNILANVLELENLTVESIMVPKYRIEAIDLTEDSAVIEKKLLGAHFNHLPAYQETLDNMIGVIPVRTTLQETVQSRIPLVEIIKRAMRPPYFIPEGTSLYKQLQHFQNNREALGLVVDEYGDFQGLLTPNDIMEEIVGEFTPLDSSITKDPKGDGWLVDGAIHLRELKRRLGIDLLALATDATTLNGLIQEILETLPEAEIAFKIGNYIIEIVQLQGQFVKKAKIKTVGLIRGKSVFQDKDSADDRSLR
jgi:Mg2+/Co2+ transporter CorB